MVKLADACSGNKEDVREGCCGVVEDIILNLITALKPAECAKATSRNKESLIACATALVRAHGLHPTMYTYIAPVVANFTILLPILQHSNVEVAALTEAIDKVTGCCFLDVQD